MVAMTPANFGVIYSSSPVWADGADIRGLMGLAVLGKAEETSYPTHTPEVKRDRAIKCGTCCRVKAQSVATRGEALVIEGARGCQNIA